MRGIDARCRRDARRGPAEGFAPAAVAWRVGWSGPGRAAGVARAVGWGVAADRAGPDRVGDRAGTYRVLSPRAGRGCRSDFGLGLYTVRTSANIRNPCGIQPPVGMPNARAVRQPAWSAPV